MSGIERFASEPFCGAGIASGAQQQVQGKAK